MWTTTDSVVSADGTRIVFHTVGDEPPLVIVHGALVTTEMYQQLAELLATDFRVVLVGRRDYAPSGNSTGPRTFTRQVEDLAAVLELQDGPSFVFGHPAGGLVTLEALDAGIPNIRRFALYEFRSGRDRPERILPLADQPDRRVSFCRGPRGGGGRRGGRGRGVRACGHRRRDRRGR